MLTMRTTKLLRQELQSKEEMDANKHGTSQSQIKFKEMAAKLSNLRTTNIHSLESKLSSVPSQTLVDNMKRLEYNADDADNEIVVSRVTIQTRDGCA